MHGTTLRGIFPEPKPTYRRNFVKENVVRIKQMQGILENSDVNDLKNLQRKLAMKRSVKSMSQSTKTSKHIIRTLSNPTPKTGKRKQLNKEKSTKIDLSASEGITCTDRIAHRAVQTERAEDISSLYTNGTIMYPSAKILKTTRKENVKKLHGHGDSEGKVSNPHNWDLSEEMQSLDIGEKHDFIKENIMSLKNRIKGISPTLERPPSHQKGVVPKYLKERKEEQKRQNEADPECPPGHVLLPDEERKETLRVLRQSYADRIKELNNMPVSNDTLKRRQRKMAIEEELKKIEEGIKVFQRPKVFVKINA